MVFVSSFSRDFSEIGGRALGDSMSPSFPLGYVGKVGLCTHLSIHMVLNSIGSQMVEVTYVLGILMQSHAPLTEGLVF